MLFPRQSVGIFSSYLTGSEGRQKAGGRRQEKAEGRGQEAEGRRQRVEDREVDLFCFMD